MYVKFMGPNPRNCLLQDTDSLESHYPNITRPYLRSGTDQCNYRRYSTEGWPGGTPLLELDSNHIEGAARSKVSRSSSSKSVEESLGLSRINAASHVGVTNSLLLLQLLTALVLLPALLDR